MRKTVNGVGYHLYNKLYTCICMYLPSGALVLWKDKHEHIGNCGRLWGERAGWGTAAEGDILLPYRLVGPLEYYTICKTLQVRPKITFQSTGNRQQVFWKTLLAVRLNRTYRSYLSSNYSRGHVPGCQVCDRVGMREGTSLQQTALSRVSCKTSTIPPNL